MRKRHFTFVALGVLAAAGCEVEPQKTGTSSQALGGSGSLSAPLYVNAIWADSSGTAIWISDAVYGTIGSIQLDPGVTASGSWSSGWYVIDTVQISGNAIQFRDSRGDWGAITLTGTGLSLVGSGTMSGWSYLQGFEGTSTGLHFTDSAGVAST